VCTDPQNDPANCGNCGNDCNGGTCQNGQCTGGSLTDAGALCGPGNCTGCCDSTNKCNPGNSNLECGIGGNACQNCGGTGTCSLGVCSGGATADAG
jgi:hypothetical protein